jgi:hypothetical protein
MAHYSSINSHVHDNSLDLRRSTSDQHTAQKENPNSFTSGESLRLFSHGLKEWVWELVAWVVGTSIITGTVILLYKFNQAPVTDWHPNIQLSTVIAVLAQTTQSSLL